MLAYAPLRLAVVVPVYNERAYLLRTIERIDAVPPLFVTLASGAVRGVVRKLVLVDDGSTDGSTDIVHGLRSRPDVTAICLPQNRGKGAALRAALWSLRREECDFAIVHDADLEYDPLDHLAVVQKLADGSADFVVGRRYSRDWSQQVPWAQLLANGALSALCNAVSGSRLSDIECGIKGMTRAVADRLDIEEDRFGVEPEFVAKVSKMHLPDRDRVRRARIAEVDVRYERRGYADGKKIRWVDGFPAVRAILKFGLRR